MPGHAACALCVCRYEPVGAYDIQLLLLFFPFKVTPSHNFLTFSVSMTLAYFCLSALDLLGGLDKISAEKKKEHIDWVYAQMVSVERPGHDGISSIFS